jgi:hypothetical protein
MKHNYKTYLMVLAISLGAHRVCPAQGEDPGVLVDSFQKATDLQREEILKENLGKEISASGAVSNVGEYDFFDIASNLKGNYYQVSTQLQKTKGGTPYQVIFLFKDKEKLTNLNKGQDLQKDGKIIRLLDERLQITVWLFCDELTEDDKLLLRQE